MDILTWNEFERVDMRCGTIVRVEDFPEARKPAYRVWVDFGEELGIKKTSAQITALYLKEELIGKQIIGVVNFAPKQIGKFTSEFLLTGFADESGAIVIATTGKPVPNGRRLM
ncbi:MAG: tRNA-binding protein [Bacteroidia bacterium]|nr:tRNA-binding protein [Bacteroidia bacterium]